MPHIPRDLSGTALIRGLAALGYAVTRQTGGHVRLTTEQPTTHHLTVPLHSPLRIGTLAAILAAVESHHQLSREELLKLILR